MVTTINNINLLAGLQTAKAVRCALEAEWLHNGSNKSSA
jgi:hypothetical protein